MTIPLTNLTVVEKWYVTFCFEIVSDGLKGFLNIFLHRDVHPDDRDAFKRTELSSAVAIRQQAASVYLANNRAGNLRHPPAAGVYLANNRPVNLRHPPAAGVYLENNRPVNLCHPPAAGVYLANNRPVNLRHPPATGIYLTNNRPCKVTLANNGQMIII